MEQYGPRGLITRDPVFLRTHAPDLLGVFISGIRRLCTASDEGVITLMDTLVLELTDGYLTISYSQQGLSCQLTGARTDIRWEADPELRWDANTVEEWLKLGDLESEAQVPTLPIHVRSVTAWIGSGSYDEILAIIAEEDTTKRIVMMTTDQFDLVCVDIEEASRRAETVAEVMNMTLIRERMEVI